MTRQLFDLGLIARLSGGGDPSPVPIFILGMPRSGSTLVEQILACHPQVQAGGELGAMARMTGVVRDAQGRTAIYPAYMSQLLPVSLPQLAGAYLGELPPLAAGKTRLTDKTPGNHWSVGLIRLMLPTAKIIHTVRDPLDTCVSCFSQLFTFGQSFCYDLGELGRYYCRYSQLMDHWQAVLPTGSLLEVRYEEVVDNLEEQARRLVDFCGLPWDDRCLDFHRNQRPVGTASGLQVRQPIYRSSIGRWRRYETSLGPLRAELERHGPLE